MTVGLSGGGGSSTTFPSPYISGDWYGPSHYGAITNGAWPLANRMVGSLLQLITPLTVQAIGLEVPVAGSAGSTLSLMVYSWPSQTLLIDAGAIDASVIGFNPIALAPTTLAVGTYVLAAVAQGTLAPAPSVRQIVAANNPLTGEATGDLTAQYNVAALRQDGVSGARPNPANFIAYNGGIPSIRVQAA